MKIGPYTLSLLKAGDFRLDGGAMFGVVPKVLWDRLCPADEANRIQMTTQCLLIEGDGRRILVDAGIGHKEKENFCEIYAVDFLGNTLERSLNALGLSPADVTDVFITHLHFDHGGGFTRREGNDVVPTFPNARHYLQRRQWEHARRPTEKDRASYFPHNYLPLHEAGLLELLEGDARPFEGIEVITAHGHTPGLQTVKIKFGSETVWYPSDLIPTAAHVPLPYIMSYDLYPLTTLEEKKRLLPQAVEENWIVVFEHDPKLPAGRIVRGDKEQFVVSEKVDL